MMRSISASYHIFSAPDAPPPMAMQAMAMKASSGWRWPRCNGQTDKGREDYQRHDTRFQQRDIVTHLRSAEIDMGKIRGHKGGAVVRVWSRMVIVFTLPFQENPCLMCPQPVGPGLCFQGSGGPPVAIPVRVKQVARDAYLMRGNSSHWWNGGGEDSCHSRVSAPSPHGLSAALRFLEKASKTPNRKTATATMVT